MGPCTDTVVVLQTQLHTADLHTRCPCCMLRLQSRNRCSAHRHAGPPLLATIGNRSAPGVACLCDAIAGESSASFSISEDAQYGPWLHRDTGIQGCLVGNVSTSHDLDLGGS